MSNPEKNKLRNQLIEICHEIESTVKIKGLNIHSSPSEKGKQNLLAFLAFRRFVSEDLEKDLIRHGLTSSHHLHPHVCFSLNKMIDNLSSEKNKPQPLTPAIEPDEAASIKENRKMALLGTNIEINDKAIMVTLDQSMIKNPEILTELLRAGMTIARINCAHDGPEIWRQLVSRIREIEAANEEGSRCKIYMDLPGPKIRITELKKDNPDFPISEKGGKIKLKKHSVIRIYRSKRIPDFLQVEAPSFAINLPKALANVKYGDRVFIDDGKVTARIVNTELNFVEAKIIRTHKNLVELKVGKGINLPDSLTYLNLPALTERDIEYLPIVCELADIIGLSFVHQPRDIQKLKEHIDGLTTKKIGIVAKIETKAAFHHLTKILLEGLNLDSFGIMIARGDLAVEMGYEQLAILQNSIKALCDAAHIPVIWATGVLEKMAKKGIPARTEITDLFIGLSADCIMLNKGPYIIEAVNLIEQVKYLYLKNKTKRSEFLSSFVQYGGY